MCILFQLKEEQHLMPITKSLIFPNKFQVNLNYPLIFRGTLNNICWLGRISLLFKMLLLLTHTCDPESQRAPVSFHVNLDITPMQDNIHDV